MSETFVFIVRSGSVLCCPCDGILRSLWLTIVTASNVLLLFEKWHPCKLLRELCCFAKTVVAGSF